MEGFNEGYSYFAKNAGVLSAAFKSAIDGEKGAIHNDFISKANAEIDSLVKTLNTTFEGHKTPTAQLKGNVAEHIHASSFNVNAHLNHSSSSAEVLKSNKYGSVDIQVTCEDGTIKNFSLKYDKSGGESAKQQAITVMEKFHKYKSAGGKEDLATYLEKRGYDEETVYTDLVYSGQYRVIPKGQLTEAVSWLKRKIGENELTRPEQAARYRETLEMLETKISDNAGIESIEFTNEEMAKIAELAKKGDVTREDLEKLGFIVPDGYGLKYVLGQAFKAGLSAALISLVLNVAPEILRAITHLIKEGYVDKEQFKNIGFAAIKGASEGFVTGTISAAITGACKLGLLGEAAKNVNALIIGAITVIAFNAIKNAYNVSKGKITRTQMANALVKDVIVTGCSLALGTVSQYFIQIPIFGYMVGSFIGSIIGTFTYEFGYKGVLSLCASTGFTMFGLVEQDYTLPEDVIQSIGIKVFDYEKFNFKKFEPKPFEVKQFSIKPQKIKMFEIKPMRRGVIGVSTIGYV